MTEPRVISNNNNTANKLNDINIESILGVKNCDIQSNSSLVCLLVDSVTNQEINIDYESVLSKDVIENIQNNQRNDKFFSSKCIFGTNKHFQVFDHDVSSLKAIIENSIDNSSIISFLHLFMYKYKLHNYADMYMVLKHLNIPFYFVPTHKSYLLQDFKEITEKSFEAIIQHYETLPIKSNRININNWYTTTFFNETSGYLLKFDPGFIKKKSTDDKSNIILKSILIYEALQFISQSNHYNHLYHNQYDHFKEELLSLNNVELLNHPIINLYILENLYTTGHNILIESIKISPQSFFDSKSHCNYPILYGNEKQYEALLNNQMKYEMTLQKDLLNITMQHYFMKNSPLRPVKFKVEVQEKITETKGIFVLVDAVTETIIGENIEILIDTTPSVVKTNNNKPLVAIYEKE